jgi:CheY-like chemotaxis protein
MRPKKVIVLVDDHEAALSVCTFLLETHGYRVYPFFSCDAALSFLAGRAQGSIDLLLSDLLMPMMNGNELVRRAKGLHPDLRTMIFSGTVENHDCAGAADVFLTRAVYMPSVMLERVRILVGRKRGPKKRVIPCVPMEITKAVA